MNTMAVSSDDTTILVDAGVMFPGPGQFGVDLIIPIRDWSPDGRLVVGVFGNLMVFDRAGAVIADLGPADDGLSTGSWQRIAP